jgi:hypothetical protein
MKLIADWRAVLKHAASVKLIVLAAVLSGIEAALPLLDLPIRPGLFALLTLVVTVAAFIARFVAQKALARSNEPQWDTGEPDED